MAAEPSPPGVSRGSHWRPEQLRQRIAQETVVLRRQKTSVTVSIGIAVSPEDASDKDQLIRYADEALYKAKEAGRNQVVLV